MKWVLAALFAWFAVSLIAGIFVGKFICWANTPAKSVRRRPF